MGELSGFVVMVTGVCLGALYVAWVAQAPLQALHRASPEYVQPSVASSSVDVYYAFALPLFVCVVLLATMVLYAVANVSTLPEVDDYRAIMDANGAKRRELHGATWVDRQRDTPFVNDASVAELNALLLRKPDSTSFSS